MDNEAIIDALNRVDRLRKELRDAELNLRDEINAFSRRRGYGWALREYHVRAQIERENRSKVA